MPIVDKRTIEKHARDVYEEDCRLKRGEISYLENIFLEENDFLWNCLLDDIEESDLPKDAKIISVNFFVDSYKLLALQGRRNTPSLILPYVTEGSFERVNEMVENSDKYVSFITSENEFYFKDRAGYALLLVEAALFSSEQISGIFVDPLFRVYSAIKEAAKIVPLSERVIK